MSLLAQAGVVQKEIGGINYSLKLLNTSSALATGEALAKLLAVPFGSAFDSGVLEDNIYDEDFGKNLAMSIVTAMGQTDVIKIIKTLLANLEADGSIVDFETYFIGKNKNKLPPLLMWSIDENGLSPQSFMEGFLEQGVVDFSGILTKMQKTPPQEEK